MTGMLIFPNGNIETVLLASTENERLRELQRMVGGYIEVVPLPEDQYMVLNENGKISCLPYNTTATTLGRDAGAIMPDDFVAGVAVIVPSLAMQ